LFSLRIIIFFALLCHFYQIFFKQICFSLSVAYITASAFLCFQERVRTFIEDTNDKDVLVLNIQDPFQRLLLHGVCEFYNVTSTTVTSARDGKPWKTTTIKKRQGTGVPSRITLVSFLRMKKNGSQ